MTTIEIPCGATLYLAAKIAVKEAIDRGVVEVCFRFNDIKMVAHPDSRPADLAHIYQLEHQIRRLKAGHKD